MSAVFSEIELPGAHAVPVKSSRQRSRAAFWEAATIAVDSIWSHKMRSILTLVGIIIGVASVVIVGGAIEGLGTYITDRMTSTFGSNTFMVSRIARQHVSEEEWEKLSKRKRLNADDMRAIEERCSDCEALSTNLRWRDDAKSGNRTFYDASINGVTSDLPRLQQLDIVEGRFLSSFDVDHARPVAVIGADIREEFFASVEPLGKEIKVGGDSFFIIGVEKRNGTFFGQSLDNSIYIPYTSFLKKVWESPVHLGADQGPVRRGHAIHPGRCTAHHEVATQVCDRRRKTTSIFWRARRFRRTSASLPAPLPRWSRR